MRSLAPIAVILGIVLLPLGGYVGAYLGMGERAEVPIDTGLVVDTGKYWVRTYHYKWLPSLFKPAAWVETRLLGEHVAVGYRVPDADINSYELYR